MTFQPKHPMPSEDRAELDYMIRFKNSDETMGWMLEDGPEAVEWYNYYMERRPHKARALLSRLADKKSYMVAAQFPQWFDPTYAPMNTFKKRLLPPEMEKVIDPLEREAIIERVLKQFRWGAKGQEAEKNP